MAPWLASSAVARRIVAGAAAGCGELAVRPAMARAAAGCGELAVRPAIARTAAR
ncbi:MAG TPA: hypothetical protein VG389_04365 [Myxococcota bacterium]|nr:hypothetical protein [Myxococcota bacterium]